MQGADSATAPKEVVSVDVADSDQNVPFDPFDTPKHECGVALLRLVRTTDYYDSKYGPGYPAGRIR